MKDKILVLRYRFIGDTILTVPFLRNLRRANPNADIHLVLAPMSGNVLKGIPYVDTILYWDPPTIHGDCNGTHRTLMDKWRFIKRLRNEGYKKVYILKRSFASAAIGFLTGARERIGFNTEGRGLLLTTRVPYNNKIHEVENFLNCLVADNVSITDYYLEAWVDETEKQEAIKFLIDQNWKPGEPFIAIHPFSSIKERSWPLERFIELAGYLYKQRKWSALWLGGKKDIPLETEIISGYKGKKLMAIGRTTIRQSMALLSFARLFVGNDSGIMHLATALDLPVAAIFGPQSETKFGPWGDNRAHKVISKRFPCRPCRQDFFNECKPGPQGRPLCLESIKTEDVIKGIDSILEQP